MPLIQCPSYLVITDPQVIRGDAPTPMSVHSDRHFGWLLLFACSVYLRHMHCYWIRFYVTAADGVNTVIHGQAFLTSGVDAAPLSFAPLLFSSPSSSPLPLLSTPSLYAFSLALIPPLPGLSNPLPCNLTN